MVALLSLVVLAAFAVSGLAVPMMEAKRGVDVGLIDTFRLMSQYASAAYCRNNHDSTGDKILCASGNCPLVQAANTTTMVEFQRFPGTDVTGYVAIDHTNKLVVVAFRGSVSIENWITNLNFDDARTDLCSGCTAHEGFWQSWVDSRPGVLSAIKNTYEKTPGYKIVTVGHSLGGAIATLAAAQLRNEGYDVALYSFGAPRIAGSTLSNYITTQPGGNFRITHRDDPVPRLPPLIMGFVHISPEYYISRKNGDYVHAGDIQVLHGSINFRGNGGHLFPDPFAHLWYFGDIAACGFDQIFDD